MLPVRVVSTAIAYRDGGGSQVQLTEPNVHHRNETLTGFADLAWEQDYIAIYRLRPPS